MPVGHPRFRSSISPASQTLSNILRLADPPFFFLFLFPCSFFSPLRLLLAFPIYPCLYPFPFSFRPLEKNKRNSMDAYRSHAPRSHGEAGQGHVH